LALLEIWRETLRRESVGLYDDFFELGGDSLLATIMLARVEDLSGIRLSLHDAFECPTVNSLADKLSEKFDESNLP